MSMLLFCCISASAQNKTLTLTQATQLALERNWSVAQAQNNVDAAQSSVLAAQGNYLPTLSASGGWNRTQNDRAASSTQVIGGQAIVFPGSFSVTNSFSAGVDLGYTIFDGFRREATLGSASSRAIASEQTSARTRQAVVFQVETGYLNVLRTEQLVKVAEENLKRDQRQLERITESNKVGALSLADVYRQQTQVAGDELALINAQNNYDKAKADLTALIGGDVFEDYVIADPSITTEIQTSELEATSAKYNNLKDLSNRALAARPDYIGASENFSASESGITAARSGYFPTISAFAGYSLANNELSKLSDNKNINWGLNIRWNIFDGFQTNQSLQSAIATKRNAEISLRQSERDINVEVKKALLNLDAARKAYEVSQKGLVSSREDRKIAEERYNLGAGTLLDLLTANAGLVSAEANKVNASYDYVIAKRNLEYVLGERIY